MSRSLAELRSAGAPTRPERAKNLCLAPHLVAEVQALSEELANLASRPGPKRAGEGEPPRAAEIRERLAVLLEEMAEHEGELRLRANLTDGEWRRWCNDNPPRAEGDPGRERDDRVAWGLCNADTLLDNLHLFVQSWEGEPLSEADWREVIEPRTATADKAEMAQMVVAMYENPLDFRQWRSALQSNLKRLSDSASPEPSESPTSGSTAGSRDGSTEASTETATASR